MCSSALRNSQFAYTGKYSAKLVGGVTSGNKTSQIWNYKIYLALGPSIFVDLDAQDLQEPLIIGTISVVDSDQDISSARMDVDNPVNFIHNHTMLCNRSSRNQ